MDHPLGKGEKLVDRIRAEFRVRPMSIRTIQLLLGHSDVSTTMIYTHVSAIETTGTASPLDRI